MRQIYGAKRRITYKDFLGWIFKIAGHHIAFSIYISFVLIFRMIILKTNFLPFSHWTTPWILYSFTLVPFINGILHISYYETGSLWSRFAMWNFTSIHMILLPILIFWF